MYCFTLRLKKDDRFLDKLSYCQIPAKHVMNGVGLKLILVAEIEPISLWIQIGGRTGST
jgi:hypothetical protein